jgi:acyl-CoA thioester hydrolase/thioesterase-3
MKPENESAAAIRLGRTRFTSVLTVRPDDIDMNQHVHASRYQDYLLAARYEQMARDYGMSMEEFIAQGFGWFVHTLHLEYKRPLKLGDTFRVTTWVDEVFADAVTVRFEMRRGDPGKVSCDGWARYTLVEMATGRAMRIPAWIMEKYAI